MTKSKLINLTKHLAGPAMIILLTSCTQTIAPKPEPKPVNTQLAAMYGEIKDGDEIIPSLDTSKMDPKNVRQIVDYKSGYPTGTIVVDPYKRFLYLVMENGKAMRYGVGVAKAGMEFEGEADISRKAQWPRWTPTQNMIKREPARYEPLAKGVEGGIHNPLGARALYLYQGGEDTLYRIHGTNEPWSIGKSVSSGCIRLLNHDIIDLHQRVPRGSKVVVLGPNDPANKEI